MNGLELFCLAKWTWLSKQIRERCWSLWSFHHQSWDHGMRATLVSISLKGRLWLQHVWLGGRRECDTELNPASCQSYLPSELSAGNICSSFAFCDRKTSSLATNEKLDSILLFIAHYRKIKNCYLYLNLKIFWFIYAKISR
jgi:hypothetical protein